MSWLGVAVGAALGVVFARQLAEALASVIGEIAQPKCLLSPGAPS